MLTRKQRIAAVTWSDILSKWSMGIAVISFFCLWPLGLVSLILALWARKYGANQRTNLALAMSVITLSFGLLSFIWHTGAVVLSAGACAWAVWLFYKWIVEG